jgi:hypothetical protein
MMAIELSGTGCGGPADENSGDRQLPPGYQYHRTPYCYGRTGRATPDADRHTRLGSLYLRSDVDTIRGRYVRT